MEDDLHRIRADDVGLRNVAALRRYCLRRQCSVGNEAVVERLAPRGVEVALDLPLPVLANEVVTRGFGRSNQREYEFVLTLPVVERRDERLNDRCCAVEGAHIAPF